MTTKGFKGILIVFFATESLKLLNNGYSLLTVDNLFGCSIDEVTQVNKEKRKEKGYLSLFPTSILIFISAFCQISKQSGF